MPSHLKKGGKDPRKTKNNESTSWGGVATWYDDLLGEKDTYQEKVILPALERLCSSFKGKRILDLACGQGYFSRALRNIGADVIGVDISSELIDLARTHSPKEIVFHVSSAHDLSFIPSASIDAAVSVLALQNINDLSKVFTEVKRVLKSSGVFMVILNHPAFRNPRQSSWGFDDEQEIQYRRLDGYLVEHHEEIDMHPGETDTATTISFHRPLQHYLKLLFNNGFAVTRFEEWVSHKESQNGPRKAAEDRARKEFPLFLMIEASKYTRPLL